MSRSVLLAGAAFAALLFIDAAVAAPFLLDDLFRTQLVLEARVSPDGLTTAYVLGVPRDPYAADDGPAWRELHVVGPEQTRRRAFIAGEVSVSKIAWTPDGSGIAFLSKRHDDEETALYVIPVDGGEARRVLAHETGVREYALAPDGDQVAFLARQPEADEREARTKKGFKAEVYEEEERPVELQVAELGADGCAAEPRRLDLDGSISELHWSPDGEHLAVALAATPGIDDHYMRRQIHVVRARDGKITGRVETAGKLGKVGWSPDSEYLALLAAAHQHDPDAGRLMVVPAKGGQPRDVHPGWEGDTVDFAFDDSRGLVFVAHDGLETYLARVRIDDDESHVHTLVHPGELALRSVSLSRDGQRGALVADASDHPRELFAWKRGTSELPRLTHHNAWLDDVELAKQEAVSYQARDGLMIDGLFLHPVDGVPRGGAPLVVIAHGGPESHYSNGWVTRYVSPGQALAARGFAVFYPNYRGSTGRGVEFAMAGQGDYAGAEFNDLIDGVEYLAGRGLADRDRVGITGGSYGGYAAAWGATALSEHFKASVMFVGVSELLSKFGTTDIPSEMYQVHARSWPWERWDHYQERSPIFHAEKHRTPLLIMHGKNDPRVHPSQSLTMYRYLKTLDQAPVRLVWYPGEGHGNRKAAARLDYAMRLVRWMEHYVTGPGGEMPPTELVLDAKKMGTEETDDP